MELLLIRCDQCGMRIAGVWFYGAWLCRVCHEGATPPAQEVQR